MIRRLARLALVLLLPLLLPAPARATLTLPPSLWYWRDGDRTAYTVTPPVTRAKAQAVLDLASDTTHLYIQFGVGELGCDSTLWLHGNTSLYGMGHGLTRFTRTRFNAADPTGAGDVICTSKNRQHAQNNGLSGGIPTDSLASIEIVGVTVDGNFQAWPDVNPNGPRNFGISLFYVDHATLRDVEVKNTGQTGITFYGCRDATADKIWIESVGMEKMLGTRNGFNFNDNSSSFIAPKRWGVRMSCTNFFIRNQKDTAFGVCNVSGVTIAHGFIYCDQDTAYGNYAVESEGAIPGYTMTDLTIEDVHAYGLANHFWTNGLSSGTNHARVKISNCSAVFSATNHHGGALNVKGGNQNTLDDFSVSHCTFTNINSANDDGTTGSRAFVYAYNTSGSTKSQRWRFEDCSFTGAGSGWHAQNRGMILGGALYDAKVVRCTFRNAEDVGVMIAANAPDTTSEVTIEDCLVDRAQREGYHVFQSGISGTVIGVRWVRNTAKDCALNASCFAFRVNATTAGSVIRSVRVEGNRVIRTSGSNMTGFQTVTGGGGIVDSVWVLNNDFAGAAAPVYATDGTGATNVFYNDVNYRVNGPLVTKNRESIYWMNASGVQWPYMRVDSSNVLHIYSQTGASIQFHKADGTVTETIGGGSTGDLNVTNGARYQLGGFRTLEKISKSPTLYMHTTDSTGGWAMLDSAGVKTLFRAPASGGMMIPRFGPVSSTIGGGAIRVVDGGYFPLTVAGVQAAIDECSAAGGGTVWVPDNANITLASTPVVLKNKVALKSFGSKTHDNGSVFKANGSTNVPFAIVAGDTTGGQQLFQLDGITIDGTGGRIDWGIYSKLNFVGSQIDNCRVTRVGHGIGIVGTNATSIGSFMVRNTIVNDVTGYCVYQSGGARNIVYDGVELDRPGRNMAALYVDGSTTSSAGNISTTVRNSYGELSDSMSVWLRVNGAAAVEVDGLHVTHPSGRFRAAVQIQNTVPGNFGFSPSGFSLRNLYADSDTLLENQVSNEIITTGPDPNNPYRHLTWYTPNQANGSATTNGYRNSSMIVGIQPARIAPTIASTATLVPHPDGSVFAITGTTGVSDVTFSDYFVGKIVVFVANLAVTVSAAGHWKINGNWVANGAGNWDTLTGYVTAGHDFVEIGRCIQ